MQSDNPVAMLPQPEVVKPQNEIVSIRSRLDEAKKIHFASRQSWKEVGANKRKADEAVAEMVDSGFGIPSAKELNDARVARWSAMTSYIDALREFIRVANENVDTLDEMVHLSKADFVAWMDRAIAELRAAMPGYNESTANSRVSEQPQHREGGQLLLDTQRQASGVRQLVKDALTAIETVEAEMREQSRKWRTI